MKAPGRPAWTYEIRRMVDFQPTVAPAFLMGHPQVESKEEEIATAAPRQAAVLQCAVKAWAMKQKQAGDGRLNDCVSKLLADPGSGVGGAMGIPSLDATGWQAITIGQGPR